MPAQQWEDEAGGREEAGRVREPRNGSRRGQEASSQAVLRGKPTVCTHRKAAVLGASGRVPRTPPGSESGACMHRGHAGTWERPLSP